MKWHLGLDKSSLSPLCHREATSSKHRWHKAELDPLQQLPAGSRSLLCNHSCPPAIRQHPLSPPVLRAFGLLLYGPEHRALAARVTLGPRALRSSDGRAAPPWSQWQGWSFHLRAIWGQMRYSAMVYPRQSCSGGALCPMLLRGMQGNQHEQLPALTLLLRDGCCWGCVGQNNSEETKMLL